MFKRILVSLDGSDRDTETLVVAEHLAEKTGASLLLARFLPMNASVEQFAHIRADLRKRVSHVWSEGIEADYIVEHGENIQTLAYVVRMHHVDLVLIVPERRDALELLWYPRSSVLELTSLPAPLLIWPDGAVHTEFFDDAASTVLVPLDGSEEAEHALPFGLLMAQGFRRKLVLARVTPMTYKPQGSAAQRPGPASTDAYLLSVRNRLAAIGEENVQVLTGYGPVSEELLRMIGESDAGLVVMTAHAQSGPARFFAGCVATNLLRRASTPVLLVPSEIGVSFSRSDEDEVYVLDLQRR